MQIKHIFREANQCADAIAKLGASSVTSFVVFLHPLPMVERILANDKARLCCNRLVNAWFNAISLLTQKKKNYI